MEQWKDIKGFEGLYQVSNLGRVKGLKRKVRNYIGTRTVKEHIYKPLLSTNNYHIVCMGKEGKTHPKTIHRLVAIAFLEPVEGMDCVNHKDGNKLNNRLDNLEWSNKSLNALHAYKTGLIPFPNGSKNVYVYKGDILISKHGSIVECAKHYGWNRSKIQHSIKLNRITREGYTFKTSKRVKI